MERGKGAAVFGTLIADMEHDQPGRRSHGFCLHGIRQRRSLGVYANTSDHKLDGWSEYAVSKDKGKTWARYNKFPYSMRPNRPTGERTGDRA
jgi:hypothetical protein